MIVELLQVYEILNGNIKLLVLLFLTNVMFFLNVRYYKNTYLLQKQQKKNLPRASVSQSDGKNVVVFIPTYKEDPNKLINAIKSVLNQTIKPRILVQYTQEDQNITESVKRFFRDNNIETIVFEHNVSKRRAVYEVAKRCECEIFCILDSDTTISKNAIEEVIRSFKEDNNIGGMIGYTEVTSDKDTIIAKFNKIIENTRNSLNMAFNIFNQIHVLDSRFVAYRYEAIKPILEEYMNDVFLGKEITIGEDKTMTYLLQKNNWKCIMNDNFITTTDAPYTLAKFIKQQIRWLRYGYYSMLKHKETLRLNWLLTYHILRYYLGPIAFVLVMIYDVITPSSFAFDIYIAPLIVVIGTTLNVILNLKSISVPIKMHESVIIALLGLFVLLPVTLFAAATFFKLNKWLTR